MINIEFHRQMMGISQAELARRAGLTAAAVSKLEKDRERQPSLASAIKLAGALQVTLDELAGLSPPASTKDLRAENMALKLSLSKIRNLTIEAGQGE